MKYFIVALAAAALVSAQNSTLIPSGLTANCTSFLSTLNSDSTLSTCVQPLINTTASFSPVSGSNLSTDDINLTLASLCKSKSGCSDSTIRTWLSTFYSSCSVELTSSTGYNAQVRELYDILYVVNPLKSAVCAIDSSNQDYCVNEIRSALSNTSSTSSASTSASASGVSNSSFVSFAANDVDSPVKIAAANLYIAVTSSASTLSKRFIDTILSRDVQSVNMATIITPNTTTYRTTNLPFMFLQPSMASSALCTPCTREIMVAYIKWESTVPYALGLAQSPILGGQSALWSAIGSTCGSTYTNAIKSEVGVIAAVSNTTSGAEMRWEAGATAVVGVAMVAGAMAVFA